MQFLISTHSYLRRISFDKNWQIQECQTVYRAPHYGIAFLSDTEPIMAVNQLQPEYDPPTSRFSVYELHDHFERVDDLDITGDIGAAHQTAFAHGGIYIANTHYNSVVFQSLDGSVRDEYHFNGHKTDINHVNSVFPCGDLVLVMLHNRKERSEVAVLEHAPGHGFRPRDVIRLGYSGCHNIYVDARWIYYCASGEQRFVVYDRAAKKGSFAIYCLAAILRGFR